MTNEPTLCRSLAMLRVRSPLFTVLTSLIMGSSTPPRRGYQRLIIPREMRAEEEPLLKLLSNC